MNNENTGKLILRLRKESNMTQKQLADAMNISDKTISKWERGLGLPDVSLLRELSEILGINVERLLSGELKAEDRDGGNMKKVKFYVCQECGNVITATGGGEISCCGRKLAALIAKPADESHRLNVQEIENDYYITFSHDMSKDHHVGFVAYVTWDRVLLIKLYPEQNPEVRFPRMQKGKIYFYCSNDGLWVN